MLRTVTFQTKVEVKDGPNFVSRAEQELRTQLILDQKCVEFEAVRFTPDETTEKLAREFIASAPNEDPAVVEKELTYSPTREELDELPDPEFTPGKKE